MKTFEEWVIKANIIYNNLYEYIDYFRKDDGYYYLNINCKIHGEFEKRIANHINKKQGCPKCAFNKRGQEQTIDLNHFVKKANEFHNGKYDYSLVVYKSTNDKVKIICNLHGTFEQTPSNHYKQGCPNCCKNIKITNDKFIERSINVHRNKYDYSNSNYVNITTPVKIICKEHGEFEQTPREHFSGCGCYKCANRIVTTKDFIEKAIIRHNNLYNYSKVEYKSAREKIIISCKTHGDFTQTPNDHLNGCGCQKCGLGNYSKICIEWLETIMKNEKIYIQHANNGGEKNIKINKKLIKFDGFCKETNTVYEFMGDFYHGNPKLYNQNDINPVNKKTFGELYSETLKRLELIKNEGYNIITIWESDYKNRK